MLGLDVVRQRDSAFPIKNIRCLRHEESVLVFWSLLWFDPEALLPDSLDPSPRVPGLEFRSLLSTYNPGSKCSFGRRVAVCPRYWTFKPMPIISAA